MNDVFAEAMEQLLNDRCTPARIRLIEQGGDTATLWAELQASGFADALLPESAGGAGLALLECFSIVFACGRHALPLPFAHTLLVRGLCATQNLPAGPIGIAGSARRHADGGIDCPQVPFGRVCDWVLAELDAGAFLLPCSSAIRTSEAGHGSLDATLHWSTLPDAAIRLNDKVQGWRKVAAIACAALLAGTQQRILEMTLAYANDRSQFGKPIGKFQAVQQQLSVMAEHVFAAKMAAQIGFDSGTGVPSELCAAVAKARAGEAAPIVAAIAHAVHGAMGFTEEYDLQLYTRRLHDWRMAYGSELYWQGQLGNAALQSHAARAVDFIRQEITAGQRA